LTRTNMLMVIAAMTRPTPPPTTTSMGIHSLLVIPVEQRLQQWYKVPYATTSTSPHYSCVPTPVEETFTLYPPVQNTLTVIAVMTRPTLPPYYYRSTGMHSLLIIPVEQRLQQWYKVPYISTSPHYSCHPCGRDVGIALV